MILVMFSPRKGLVQSCHVWFLSCKRGKNSEASGVTKRHFTAQGSKESESHVGHEDFRNFGAGFSKHNHHQATDQDTPGLLNRKSCVKTMANVNFDRHTPSRLPIPCSRKPLAHANCPATPFNATLRIFTDCK